MSRREAGGGGGRGGAARATAAALMLDLPGRLPRAARARAQAPAPQRGLVSASHRRSLCALAVAPCGSFPPASPTLSPNHGRQRSAQASALFPNPGGPTMAKPAQSIFYDPLKSVPCGGFLNSSSENSKQACKPLILRCYTLCEVSDGKRQSVPPRKPAFLRRQNRPVSGSSADRVFSPSVEGRRILSGSSVIPGLSLMGETSAYLTSMRPSAPKRPANPHPAVGQKSAFFGSQS